MATETTIDSLSIEISSNSTKASTGIDALIAKLQALNTQTNKSLSSLKKLSTSLQNVSTVSKKIKDIKLNVDAKSTTGLKKDVLKNVTGSQQTDKIDLGEKLKLDTLKGDLDKTTQSINTFRSSISNMNFSSQEQQISALSARLKELQKTSSASRNVLSNTSVFGNAKSTVTGAINNAGQISFNIDQRPLKEIKPNTDEATESLNTLKESAQNIGEGLDESGRVALAIFSKLKSKANSSINSITNNFTKLRKSISRLSLALLGVRGLFTGLRKAVSAYLAYDTQLSKQLQNDWAVLGSLLAPILEKLINLFSTLVAYVNAFVKALFGVDLVAKANSKALGGTASSAKKAGKEIKDALGNLQDFDDLHVVTFDTDKTAGSSGGSGTGLEPLTVGKVDTTPIEEFLEWLKNKDWYGIGMEIGRKINEGLSKIPWDTILDKARKWATNLADLMNGLTDGIDWDLIGYTFAQGLNTITMFVDTFFDRYNFVNLGKSLARALNSAINTVDWKRLGETITDGLKGAVETAYGFTSTFDWKKLGSSLGIGFMSAFDNIPWDKAGTTIHDGVTGVFESIGSFLDNINTKDLLSKIGTFIEKLDITDIINKFIKLVAKGANKSYDLLKNEIDWKLLGKKLGEGLTKIDYGSLALVVIKAGIASTTLLVPRLGYALVTAIIEFLKIEIPKIPGQLKKAFETLGTNTINFLKTHLISKLSPEQIGLLKTAGSWVTTFGDNLKTMKSNIDELKTAVKKKFTDMASDTSTPFGKIATGFSTAISKMKTKISDFKDWVKKKISDIGSSVSVTISEKFKEAFTSLLKKVVEKLNKFVDTINGVITKLNDTLGTKMKKLDKFKVPALATGTNYIPREGLYYLHQGEEVVPKKYNPTLDNKSYTENSKEIISELRRINNSINNQEQTTIINVDGREKATDTRKKQKRQTNIYGKTIIA